MMTHKRSGINLLCDRQRIWLEHMQALRNGFFLSSALLIILAIGGCSSNLGSNDRQIEVHLIDAKTEAPSEVRLFFQIDTDYKNLSAPDLQPEFEILENGSRISIHESKARIRKEPGEFLYSSLLLLDLSGSILNNSDLPRLKEAASTFIERTMPQPGEEMYGTREMAVYWFDGEEQIHLLVPFTGERDSLLAGVESIHEE